MWIREDTQLSMDLQEVKEHQNIQDRVYAFLKGADKAYEKPPDFDYMDKLDGEY